MARPPAPPSSSSSTFVSTSRPRVIVLVDMDCFYVQVEKRLDPSLRDHPCAVVQYNKWKGGGIIAVDYEARKYGVKRNIRGNEARQKCPLIRLIHVPEKRGKADLTKYRHAGAEVISILSRYTSCIERASVDEAYLDITNSVFERMEALSFKSVLSSDLPSTHVAGLGHILAAEETILEEREEGDQLYDHDSNNGLLCEGDAENGSSALEQEPAGLPQSCLQNIKENETAHESNGDTDKEACRIRLLGEWLMKEGRGDEMSLAVGAIVAREMREAVFKETGFTCSAGIAHNKMLAKLAAGMNKPNQQTILPANHVERVFSHTPLRKVRFLGGKLGAQIQQQFGLEYVGELTNIPIKTLEQKFGSKTGEWLYHVSRGVDNDPVSIRTIVKSIGCGKNFPGSQKLATAQKVLHWLGELAAELCERLAEDQRENCRRAEQLSVHFHPAGSSSGVSRSCPLRSYTEEHIVSSAWAAINKGHSLPKSIDPAAKTPLTWTAGLQHLALNASKFTSSSSGSLTMKSFLSSSISTSCDTTTTVSNTAVTSCSTISTAANASFSSISTCLPIEPSEVVHSSYSTSVNEQNEDHTNESLGGCDKEHVFEQQKDITIHSQRLSTSSSFPSPTSTSKAKRRRSTNAVSHRSTSSIQSYFTPLANKACAEADIDNISITSTEPVEETQHHKRCKIEEELVSGQNTSGDKQSTSCPDGATSCPLCGAMVSGCMAEHLDYHTALELQESFQSDSSFEKTSMHKETNRKQLPSQEKIQMFFKRT